MRSLTIGKDIVRRSYQQAIMDEMIKSTAGVSSFTVPARNGMSPGRAIAIGLSNAETTLANTDPGDWDVERYSPEELRGFGLSAHEVMQFLAMPAEKKREKLRDLEVRELRKRMADLIDLFR